MQVEGDGHLYEAQAAAHPLEYPAPELHVDDGPYGHPHAAAQEPPAVQPAYREELAALRSNLDSHANTIVALKAENQRLKEAAAFKASELEAARASVVDLKAALATERQRALQLQHDDASSSDEEGSARRRREKRGSKSPAQDSGSASTSRASSAQRARSHGASADQAEATDEATHSQFTLLQVLLVALMCFILGRLVGQ